jgi:hypothetical protein
MANWNSSITRSNAKGLQVTYESALSPSAQISIRWNNGLGGGVGMSIKQAKELQGLLDDALSQANHA